MKEQTADLRHFLAVRVRSVGGFLLPLEDTAPGLPDVIVFLPGGGAFFVELRVSGMTTFTERFWRSKLRLLGTQIHCLESKKEVVGWLKAAVDHTQAVSSAKRSTVRPARPDRQPAQTVDFVQPTTRK